jgi:hypothetical protein
MADVNAWSIVVPGVVTPTVVAVFAFSQQRAQRKRDTVAELRVVVDDAARALAEVYAVTALLDEHWQDATKPSPEVTAAAWAALSTLRCSSDRLAIRLGPDSPVAQAHQDAGWAAVRLVRRVYDGAQTGVGKTFSDRRAERKKINKAHAKRRVFLLEAKAALQDGRLTHRSRRAVAQGHGRRKGKIERLVARRSGTSTAKGSRAQDPPES